MSDTMGTFRIEIEIENPAQPGERAGVSGLLVDTGSELTWVTSSLVDAGPAPAAAGLILKLPRSTATASRR